MKIDESDPEVKRMFTLFGITDPDQIKGIFNIIDALPENVSTELAAKIGQSINNPNAETLKARSKLFAEAEYNTLQKAKKTTWLN